MMRPLCVLVLGLTVVAGAQAIGPKPGEKHHSSNRTVKPKPKGVRFRTPEENQAIINDFKSLPDEERHRIIEGARQQQSMATYDIAENLRKSRKFKPARAYYQEILREYRDLPEATKAKERLKTLPK